MINLLQRIKDTPFFRFLAVGGVGFVVDAGILHALHIHFSLLISRLCSFAVAVTVTWALNRYFTFQSEDKSYRKEWMRYTLVNGIGGLVNFLGFFALVHREAFLGQYPIFALLLSSAAAAFFNYFFSKTYAFKAVRS